MRKVNIDTDIRLAMTGAVRKFQAENPEKFDMREWMKPAREAAKAICKQRYLEFGCEGQAAKIKGYTAGSKWPGNTRPAAGLTNRALIIPRSAPDLQRPVHYGKLRAAICYPAGGQG